MSKKTDEATQIRLYGKVLSELNKRRKKKEFVPALSTYANHFLHIALFEPHKLSIKEK